MKKFFIICMFLLLSVIYIINPTRINAYTSNINEEKNIVSQETIYYEDGSYVVIILYENTNTNKSDYSINSTIYEIAASRDVIRYNSNDTIAWKYTLTGYFRINPGLWSVCYNATYSYIINTFGWSFSNGSATCSEITAYGKGTFTDKFLFIVISTVVIDISVSCDPYGNLF